MNGFFFLSKDSLSLLQSVLITNDVFGDNLCEKANLTYIDMNLSSTDIA